MQEDYIQEKNAGYKYIFRAEGEKVSGIKKSKKKMQRVELRERAREETKRDRGKGLVGDGLHF